GVGRGRPREGARDGGGGRPHGPVLRARRGRRGAPGRGPGRLPAATAHGRRRPARRRAVKALGAFALFFAATLALTWHALRWPMVFDDLHLVRTFRASELAAAWTGHWDPDGLETPGLRPLSLAFNHARASLCGEEVVAHRALLVALFALDLALLLPLGARAGLPPAAALAAGLLMLATRYTAYHLVWVTDRYHLVHRLAFLQTPLLLVGDAEPS